MIESCKNCRYITEIYFRSTEYQDAIFLNGCTAHLEDDGFVQYLSCTDIQCPRYEFQKVETRRVDKENNWIPVTERLPENIKTVIIQTEEFDYPTFGWYANMDNQWNLTEKGYPFDEITVTAWMPLPEPYKGGGANE